MATWKPDNERRCLVICHHSSPGKSVLPPLMTLSDMNSQPNGKWQRILPFAFVVSLIRYHPNSPITSPIQVPRRQQRRSNQMTNDNISRRRLFCIISIVVV